MSQKIKPLCHLGIKGILVFCLILKACIILAFYCVFISEKRANTFYSRVIMLGN